ncbi:hypothetical protein AB0J52_24775, partial [Spirillospora sp. NPDC049652]
MLPSSRPRDEARETGPGRVRHPARTTAHRPAHGPARPQDTATPRPARKLSRWVSRAVRRRSIS